MEGQDVTLSPVDPTGFVGWSLFECPGTGACTINVDSDRTVVATFSPTTLTVIVEGALPDPQSFGRVTSLDGKIDCSGPPTQTCVDTTFQAFAEVTLTAEPAADFEKWSGACQGEDETQPTCTLLLSGDDVVGAKFKNNTDPEIIPPRQQAQLRVSVEPQGAGTVTSSRSRLSEAINCSPTCKARFEQGERPTLTATGPSFVGWVGGGIYCTSKPTCRYPAFRTTSIKAVFKAPSPPPPPPPPPPPSLPPVPGPCQRQQVGTASPDRLDGGRGGDKIFGRGGNDRIRGLAGDDCLYGGKGNDTLKGGKGKDLVGGGPGADTLDGGSGRDVLNGNAGPDRIFAADGARDTVSCGPGRDVAHADRFDKLVGCERHPGR
jgi:hypothetical protein